MAEACLAHRLILNPTARVKDVSGKAIVAEVLNAAPVPGARARRLSH